MRILLTGAGGFVGSHALKYLLTQTSADVVCLVSFERMGVSARIRQVAEDYNAVANTYDHDISDRVKIIRHDLRTPIDTITREQIGPIDVIWNIASESHVDRSITHPRPFILNNTELILTMLEYARVAKPKLFLQMSTDEVYGPAPAGHNHVEWETPLPSNPYSASKAAQEAIAFSYWRTYGVPVVITNTMNIIGEMQDAEKFAPMVMQKVHSGEAMTIHASPSGEIGSRYYLHAYNLADAWWFLTESYVLPCYITNGGQGYTTPDIPMYGDGVDRPAKFHIVGEREIDNLQFAKMIATEMGEPFFKYELVDFHSSRPGHDLRYALDGTKMEDIGWRAPLSLDESVQWMVDWTQRHKEWLS